jgi:hypothetical protein
MESYFSRLQHVLHMPACHLFSPSRVIDPLRVPPQGFLPAWHLFLSDAHVRVMPPCLMVTRQLTWWWVSLAWCPALPVAQFGLYSIPMSICIERLRLWAWWKLRVYSPPHAVNILTHPHSTLPVNLVSCSPSYHLFPKPSKEYLFKWLC